MSEIQFANLVAKFSTVLSVGISDVATSMVLESITTRDGEPLDGGLYAFVIDRGLENEEFVIGTLAETGVFTFLVRGVSYIDGATSIPANIFAHRKGATIEITAHPVLTELVNRFTDFFNTYNGKWSGAVADYASLPEGQNDGEARITLDDSKIYVWSAAEESWKLSGAGGAGGTVYVTNKLGSESVGGDMKTFVLDSGSFPLDKFLQVYLNGTLQELATDYTTSNNNTIIFENEVEATDKITMLVVSVSLVALGGVLTQDVIPDTDEAYNIGSDEYKVNEIHAKELNATNIIDPDNPVAQSPAKLIGGDDVVLQNFIDLGAGANDGKFTANIDGVEYEDLALDLVNGFVSSNIEQLSSTDYNSTNNFGQSFKNVSLKVIKTISLKAYTWNDGSGLVMTIYEGDGYSGPVIATSTNTPSPNSEMTFTFNPVILKAGYTYTFRVVRSSGAISPRFKSSSVYADGKAYWGLTPSENNDFYFIISASTFSLANDGINYILFLLNEKIKTETGREHEVIYNTDHFEITNAVAGFYKSILKLTAPTTGTDISGAGYLDLGA
ncbi:hypothetical protein, partial [Methanoculleus sp.]|uniref:hypothetical protein n=1 Tax=Methanoculleus sp. TaxID=90427 RepID=UPI0025F43B9F